VAAVRPFSKLFFDVHLMCAKPQILLEPFAKAGGDQLIIHVELGTQAVSDLLWKIRSLGKKAGLAVNPPTAIGEVLPYLNKIDSLLVMTVNPGFGGQKFLPEMLSKIRELRRLCTAKGLDPWIEVDGGQIGENAALAIAAGADAIVAGSAIFGSDDYATAIARLRNSTLHAKVA
jgi:ribulose-phosphate 3-epimerase